LVIIIVKLYRTVGRVAKKIFLCHNSSMLTKALNWFKRNWQFLLILFLIFFLFKRQTSFRSTTVSETSYKEGLASLSRPKSGLSLSLPFQESVPAPEVQDRLVIQNTTLSLLVQDVRNTQDQIIKKSQELGGYMVESQISSPLGVESGTVIVRVPAKDLDLALSFFRSLGVRVIAENLVGRDVTDEYVDIQSRLETLQKTKAKFEEIMAKAEKVDDILRVQREIINLQEQIDSLKGRQQYLEKSAEMAKVTVYLSTDELALPYSPTQPWRPQVIFKQAVRSLIKTGRVLAGLAIWLGVYSIVWAPALGIGFFFRKKYRRGK